ncbi:MAG: hypothetical protein AAF355_05310 [Myxococcota bacterium]
MHWKRAILSIGTFLLLGCDDERLSGSLDTVYPLEYESLRARLYSSSLSLEYVRSDGSVPIRVTANRALLEAGAQEIDLVAEGDLTGRTSDEREIPRLSEGRLTMRSFGIEEDANIKASWSAQFQVSETDRLAVQGSFSAPLEVVPDPGPPPPVFGESSSGESTPEKPAPGDSTASE